MNLDLIDKYINNLFKDEWYIQTFNGVPLMLSHGGVGATKLMWKSLGYGHEYTINEYSNDKCDMYYHIPSLKNIYNKLMKNYYSNKSYIKKIINISKFEMDNTIFFLKTLKNLNLRNLSNDEFISLFNKLQEVYNFTASTTHIIEGFSLLSDYEMKSLLLKHLKLINKEKELSKIFTILSTPTEKSLISKEDISLHKLSNYVNKTIELKDLFNKPNSYVISNLYRFPEFLKMLIKHKESFFWINSSYAKAEIKDLIYFVDLIKQKMNESSTKFDDSTKHETKKKLLNKLKIKGKLIDLIEISEQFIIWQDWRKKIILSTTSYIYEMIKELELRYKIPKKLAVYLMVNEINDSKLKSISLNTLKIRKKGCVVICDRKGQYLLEGSNFKKFKSFFKEKEVNSNVKEISGMSASIGKVIGNVQIINNLKDIENFRKGNILVTSMTRPEFISAMKKASAIITDEGGITSHAAIVARELKIPCIIGTKNATKILKDGMLVEVKANHGMVVIINN